MCRTVLMVLAGVIWPVWSCQEAFGELPTLPKVHVQYWKYLQDLMAAEAARQEGLKAGEAATGLGEYTFGAIQPLECAGLIYATTWAIRDGENKHQGADQALIDQQIRANIALCLEYYPVAAKHVSDYGLLVDTIRGVKNHPLVRVHLLEQLNPEEGAQSMLGVYLSDESLRRFFKLDEVLRSIARREMEEESAQLAALRAWHRLSYQAYRKAFDNSGEVVTLNAQRETPLSPAELVGKSETPFSRRTQGMLERISKDCRDMASASIELLKLTHSRSPEFLSEVRGLIEHVLREVPVQGAEELRGRLAAIDARQRG